MTPKFSPELAADLVARLRASRRCKECQGDGFKTYSDTTCGRGGAGGQMITTADCHRCKGQGWIVAPDAIDLAAQLEAACAEVAALRQERHLERHHPMAPEKCPVCNWTNVNLMNYGEPGRSRWMCHGCAARALSNLESTRRELERWRHGVTVEGDFVCPSDLERDSLRSALSSSRAECEELRKERDEAIENREQMVELRRRDVQLIGELKTARSENGFIFSNVNDAINRAGIHCAITFWEAIDQIAAERDSARAELAKMRPVYEAALEWRVAGRAYAQTDPEEDLEADCQARKTMTQAMDRLRAIIDSATKGPADE